VDTDADTDCDEDGGIGDCGPPWGWYDETSGLCWQDPPHDVPLGWEEAIDHCDALALGGRCDWRLPSISELRSFVRGCPATVTGGECGVTDDCSSGGCSDLSSCYGCPGCEGPGLLCSGDEPAGLYFHPDVVGSEIYQEKNALWSSTPTAETDLYVWILATSGASIMDFENFSEEYQTSTSCAVMCVRDGL